MYTSPNRLYRQYTSKQLGRMRARYLRDLATIQNLPLPVPAAVIDLTPRGFIPWYWIVGAVILAALLAWIFGGSMHANTLYFGMGLGLDYGLGKTNIDTATGIRYGVISQHSLADWFHDEFESDYGDPTCPVCGNEVGDTSANHADGLSYDDTDYTKYASHGCDDYVCHTCKHTLDTSDVWPEEPIGWHLDVQGIRAVDCLDSDVMVLVSPYYTYAPFCSPCVPGAGNLDSSPLPLRESEYQVRSEGYVKTYCFDHTWFSNHIAPYRVFRVSDDTEVFSDEV